MAPTEVSGCPPLALCPSRLRSLARWEKLVRRSGWIGAALAGTVTVPVFVHVIGYTEANIDDEANNWLLLSAFLVPLAALLVLHVGAGIAWARAVAQVGAAGRPDLEVRVAELVGRGGKPNS